MKIFQASLPDLNFCFIQYNEQTITPKPSSWDHHVLTGSYAHAQDKTVDQYVSGREINFFFWLPLGS